MASMEGTGTATGSDEVNDENDVTQMANRIIEILEQIIECLDEDDIAEIYSLLSNINTLCKNKDDKAEDELDEQYLKFMGMVEFRSGISVYLINQALRAFMIIEDDTKGLGKKVSEMFLEMMLSEYPSLMIDMQLTDELLKVYFKLLKEASEKIQHIRLMVVGMYGVGKSSLVNRLCKKPIADVTPTVGIDILLESCEVKDDLDWELSDHDNKERFFNQRLQELITKYRKLDSTASDHPNEPKGFAKSIQPQQTTEPVEPYFKYERFRENIETKDQSQPAGLKIVDNLKQIERKETLKRRPTVSIWDFAGQSVYYSTHHFFLNARSIYIVVLDLSKGLHEVVKEENKMNLQQNLILGNRTGSTCLDFFKFWMKSIYIYTKQTKRQKHKEYKPKIILVGTFKDGLTTEKMENKLLEKYKEDYFNEALLCFTNTPIMDLVHDKKFVISNKDDPEEDFLNIKKEIYNISKDMPFWDEEIPAKFIPLERSVFHSKLEKKGMMKFSELQEVGENIEYPHSEAQEIKLFLNFQHAFGNLLYYDIENVDDQMIILSPQWIIDAFKALVTHKGNIRPTALSSWREFEKFGKLRKDLLDELLAGDKFKENKEQIKKYMEYLDVIAKPVKFTDIERTVESSRWATKRHFRDSDVPTQTEEPDFYIMPCMLPQIPEVDEIKTHFEDTDATHTPTLCLYIKKGLLPPFILHCLIATALKEMPSTISFGKTLLFNGLGSFQLTDTQRLIIWSLDNIIHLRVTFKGELDSRQEMMNFCRSLRGRFEELVLQVFNFHGKDTYNQENKTELFDFMVKCPDCPEQVPFEQKTDPKTERPFEYRLSLLKVDNLQFTKETVCGCCNNLIRASKALDFWFTPDGQTNTQFETVGADLVRLEDPRLKERPSDHQLIEIVPWITDHFQKLAIELNIDDKTVERLGKSRWDCIEYLILYEWKKTGECWKMLFDAMKRADVKFDSSEFFLIIDEKDSDESKDLVIRKLAEIPNSKLSELMIVELAECIGNEYWFLGLRLGIAQAKMEQMAVDYQHRCKDHIMEILRRWNRQDGQINKLIRAFVLSKCDWSRIRNVICCEGTRS